MKNMTRLDIAKRFSSLSSRAEKANAKLKERRLYPMSEYKSGKLAAFGIYDYKKKKYIFSDIRDLYAEDFIQEIEEYILSIERIIRQRSRT